MALTTGSNETNIMADDTANALPNFIVFSNFTRAICVVGKPLRP